MARKGRMIRVNLDDPKMMEQYLRNGAVWRVKQFWPDAIRAIREGLVPLSECQNVPPEVMEVLNDR